MNIFFLDTNPEKAAQAHYDRHVTKMIVEYTQMLSNAVILNGGESPYKLSHNVHPSSKWVNQSLTNWRFLFQLNYFLNEEKKFRFKKEDHKSWIVTSNLLIPKIEDIGFTKPPLCMPIEFWSSDTIESYRNYYTFNKASVRKYTKRDYPQWMKDKIVL